MIQKQKQVNKSGVLGLLRYISPHLVFVTQNPKDETDRDLIMMQENFLKLSDEIKDKLSSVETARKIEDIGRRYNFELEQIAVISRAIRDYYFGKIELDQFTAIFSENLAIDQVRAQDISNYIVKYIIEKDISGAKIEEMTLTEALNKYPALRGQLITSSPISPTRPDGEIKRPSLGNWIEDYVNIMGREKHSMMERSRYLYGGKSTRNVSAADKKILLEMIRLLEEGSTVKVDLARNKVLFGNGGGSNRLSTTPKINTEQYVENTPNKIESAPVMENRENHVIKRAQNGNMEMRSDHHFDDKEFSEENIKSMKFDAPHRLPNEK